MNCFVRQRRQDEQLLVRSGVFDTTPLAVFNDTQFKVVSWNARAPLARNPIQRQKKVDFVRELTNKSDVVMIQELHGTCEDLFVSVGPIHPVL